MTNENPYRDLSKTLRLDVQAVEVSRVRKGSVLKQSQAIRIDLDSIYQKLDVNVSLTNSFTLGSGYKHALVISSPYSFKVTMTKDDNTIEQTCTGVYSTIGSFDGEVVISGLEEDFTRCSLVTA